MPVYQYEGKHYSLPDGLSDEQAVAKIKAHLGGGAGNTQPEKSVLASGDDKYNAYLTEFNTRNKPMVDQQGRPLVIPGSQTPTPMSKEEFLDWRNRPNMLNAITGAAETGLNFVGGVGGMLVAPIGAAMKSADDAVRGEHGAGFEHNYDAIMRGAGSIGTSIADATGLRTTAGDKGNELLSEAINQVGLPMGPGLHLPGRYPKVSELRSLLPEKKAKVAKTDTVLDNVQKALETPPEITPEIKAATLTETQQAQQAAFNAKMADWLRQTEAQRVLEERQRAMEQDVARQGLLDRNAAERARQEQAPTGYEQWVEQQRQAAEQRQPGNNTPMEFESPYPVKAADYPNVLGEAPHQYEGGIDFNAAEQKALPITIADHINQGVSKRSPVEVNPMDRANQILSGTELARKRPAKDAPRRGGKQSGAIDLKGVLDSLEKLRAGVIHPKDYVKSFLGAFNQDFKHDMSWTHALEESRDPKSRTRLVLMSPDTFHKLAMPRDKDYVNSTHATVRRNNVEEALTYKPEGLDSMPMLRVDSGKVYGHEGRHRMDVFKQMGVEQVPVILRDVGVRNEAGKLPYKFLISEGGGPSMARYHVPMDAITDVFHGDNKPLNSGMSRGQRGGLNIRDIARTADEATTKLKAALRSALPARTDADKLLGNTIRDNSFIVKHKSGEEMAAAIAAGPDYPFWKLGQSGLVNAGDKAGNAGVSMVGRALNWSKNMENKLVRDHVKPVEKHFSLLPKQDLQYAMKIMHMEDQANKRLTPEQLREAGVSDKAIEAIQQFRKVTDQGIEMINANNKLLGMREVSRRDAYFSSQSNGDYVIRGTDGNGKPIFTTAETLWGAKKAQKWIQENVPGAKDLKMIDRRDGYQGRGPRDVTNTYETLMEVFHDTPMGAELQQLMEQYKQNQAFDARGFSSHFLDKSGARFFLGDRPWLSAEKNAEQAAQAQVKYLKDMYRWIPAQEMMVDVKKVLGNEELQQSHPHSMSLINAYVNQYFGVAENILRRFEDKAGQAMGLSGSVMRSQLAGVKSMTYHLQLGFSTGYAIATPLQMLPMATASHMMLSNQGLKHNPIITTAKTLRDVNYALKVRTGELVGANLSKADRVFANEAIRFMEDNGVITKTFRDEYASLGSHPVLDAAAKISEKTITAPDHFARMLGFFSFAHHLKDSGVKMSNLEIFQKAAELTEKAAVPLDRHNRPLLFDQFGMVGEAASMYKAPVFQYYNNLIELGSNAYKTKNFKPFIAFLAISYAMGGMLGLPGVKEADSVIELMKDWMSKMPGMEEASIKMKDFGIRQSMMDYTPDWNTYGALSKLTGINLQSRFTNEAFDAQHPLGAFSPVAQEMKEWGSLGLAALHRDKASVEQGIYDAAANPMMKGWMENNLSDFQGTTAGGKTQVIKPTDIRSHKPIYARDDKEKLLRSLGLYSTEEAKTRELRFRGQQDDMRMTPVRDRLIGELVHKLITKQNTDGYVQKFFEAGGEDSELAKLLDSKLTSTMGTPEQLAVMKANTIREFQSIQRNQRRGMKY